MKVSGFSFIKNAVRYGYPILPAIRSVLPLCDEFVIAVGDCQDGTRELIESLKESRIRILDTVWDESLKTGGRVLADETNKAFGAVAADSDWAFYIQGDEVMHERYLDTVRQAMTTYRDDPRVDGLLFNYYLSGDPMTMWGLPRDGTERKSGSSATTEAFIPTGMPRDSARGTIKSYA